MEKEEKFWSQFAEEFDSLNNYVVGKDTMKVFLNQVGELEDLGEVLEIACGNGTYTKVLAKNASHIIATDFSKRMVEVTKNNLKDYEHIEIRAEDAFHLSFEDDSFDTVFLANFLHVVEDCNSLLKELYRVLKPEGRLITMDVTMYGMTFFNKLGMIYRFMKTYGKPEGKAEKSNLTPEYVEVLFSTNGFKQEELKVIGEASKGLLAVGRKK